MPSPALQPERFCLTVPLSSAFQGQRIRVVRTGLMACDAQSHSDLRVAPYNTADAMGNHGQQVAPTVDTHAWYLQREAAASRGRFLKPD